MIAERKVGGSGEGRERQIKVGEEEGRWGERKGDKH